MNALCQLMCLPTNSSTPLSLAFDHVWGTRDGGRLVRHIGCPLSRTTTLLFASSSWSARRRRKDDGFRVFFHAYLYLNSRWRLKANTFEAIQVWSKGFPGWYAQWIALKWSWFSTVVICFRVTYAESTKFLWFFLLLILLCFLLYIQSTRMSMFWYLVTHFFAI